MCSKNVQESNCAGNLSPELRDQEEDRYHIGSNLFKKKKKILGI